MQHIQLTHGGSPLLVPLTAMSHGTILAGQQGSSIIFIGAWQFGVTESPAEIMTLIEAAQLDTRHGTAADIKRLANAADFLVKMIRDIRKGDAAIGAFHEMNMFGEMQDLALLAETAARYLTRPYTAPAKAWGPEPVGMYPTK